MAWSRSAVFRAWVECALAPEPGWAGGWNLPDTGYNDFRCSLWKDGITPDETAPADQTGFAVPGEWEFFNANTGQGMDSSWQGGDPVVWPQGGPRVPGTGQLGGFSSAAGLITFGGGNPTSAGVCTMEQIYGDLVFGISLLPPVAPVARQGLAFHYFGGEQKVTNGTFTVVWPPEGVAQLQLV